MNDDQKSEAYDELAAENGELRAELARVRGERDRAVAAAVFFGSQRSPGRRAQRIEIVVRWISQSDTVVPPEVAAALAEHDAQHRKG